jgi:hypothetical protein
MDNIINKDKDTVWRNFNYSKTKQIKNHLWRFFNLKENSYMSVFSFINEVRTEFRTEFIYLRTKIKIEVFLNYLNF